MTFSLFSKQIGLLTALILSVTFLFGTLFGDNGDLFRVYGLSCACFVVFNVFIFFYAYNTSQTDNLFSFNNIVSASFLIKLFMSVGFLILFDKIFEPTTKNHVIHYLMVYLIYTAYEVYFLTKLAKN